MASQLNMGSRCLLFGLIKKRSSRRAVLAQLAELAALVFGNQFCPDGKVLLIQDAMVTYPHANSASSLTANNASKGYECFVRFWLPIAAKLLCAY
jgi:hypothetical protein